MPISLTFSENNTWNITVLKLCFIKFYKMMFFLKWSLVVELGRVLLIIFIMITVFTFCWIVEENIRVPQKWDCLNNTLTLLILIEINENKKNFGQDEEECKQRSAGDMHLSKFPQILFSSSTVRLITLTRHVWNGFNLLNFNQTYSFAKYSCMFIATTILTPLNHVLVLNMA